MARRTVNVAVSVAVNVAVVVACICVGMGAGARGQETGAPRVFTTSPEGLVAAKARIMGGDVAAKKALADIVKEADAAVADSAVYSVMNKPLTPPSGDKHDYASLSPYWWPDPSKPDGKPYVRHDGEFNPEREKYDLGPLDKVSGYVDALSLAYYFTGEEKYASKCAGLIRTWIVDPATKMNPNLTYGQFVPGYDEPRPSGIIEGGRLKKFVDAIGLMKGSAAWSDADDKAARAFFRDLKTYIQTSKQGSTELNQPNNHGTWASVQVGTYALFLGEDSEAKDLIERQFKARIDSQIKPDGSQPEELARTQSFHYSRFNLNALMDLADLGDRVGLDLWNYKTADGRSLRTAIDFLLPAALGEKEWVKKDIRDPKIGDMIPLLRRAANKYNEPKYEAAAKKLQEKDRRERVDLLIPSKL